MGIMLGKAVKLAQGALNTHSNQSSWDKDWVAGVAAEAGYPAERCAAIAQLTLASGLTELFPFSADEPFYAVLARHCHAVINTVTGTRPCQLVLIDATEQFITYDFDF